MAQRILILEDEPVVLSYVATVLKGRGYDVMTATAVPEARQLLAQQPGDASLCLIIDVVLDEDSGIGFAQEVIAHYPNHRILLVSGFTDEVLLGLPEQSEKIGFLKKPFTRAELIASMDAICAK